MNFEVQREESVIVSPKSYRSLVELQNELEKILCDCDDSCNSAIIEKLLEALEDFFEIVDSY